MTQTLLIGTRREIERELAQIDAQLAELRMQRETYRRSFEYEVQSNVRLIKEIKRLREGVMDYLHAARHQADQDSLNALRVLIHA